MDLVRATKFAAWQDYVAMSESGGLGRRTCACVIDMYELNVPKLETGLNFGMCDNALCSARASGAH